MAYRSSGSSNDELVHNLKNFDIVTDERVYEAMLRVDRGHFAPDEARREAYFDQPFLHGKLHMSAPHIYGTVLSALDLQPGQAFLNMGSGTGYLSTIAGCLLGGRGVNHGVDLDEDILEHARSRHLAFIAHANETRSSAKDDGTPSLGLDVTRATFFLGNAFHLNEERSMRYDRIYVGAACPPEVRDKLTQLLLPGGVMVGPMGDELVRIVRECAVTCSTTFLAAVRFAPLRPRPALPVCMPRPVWSVVHHFTYPDSFRASVLTLLVAANRQGSPCASLPKAVWMEVVSFMDRDWFDTGATGRLKAAYAADSDGSKRARLSGGPDLFRRLGGLRSAVWGAAAAATAAADAEDGDSGDGHGFGARALGVRGLLATLLLGMDQNSDGDDDDEDEEEEEQLTFGGRTHMAAGAPTATARF